MDDATYFFMQDVKDRKRAATGAYHKRTGSRSRKVTLSQDTLTHAQWKRRNGPVQTYDMNKPHTWKELKLWPEPVRHEYMANLLNNYEPSNKELAQMLNTSPNNIHSLVAQCGIMRSRGGSRSKPSDHEARWYCFLAGEEHVPLAPDPEPVPEQEPEPKPSVSLAPITYDTITIGFTGTATDLVQSILTGPVHLCGADTYTFTLTAVRKP